MAALDSSSPGRQKIVGRVGFVLYVVGVCALLGYTLIPTTKVDSPLSVPSLTHTDERIELQADYPSNWHLQSFNKSLGKGGDHVGFIISNADHDLEHADPDKGIQSWDMRALPESAVVIEVSLNAGFTYTRCERATDELPLDLSTFDLARDQPSYGAPPRLWAGPCIEGAYLFGNHVWLFPDASTKDREAADAIVRSIALMP